MHSIIIDQQINGFHELAIKIRAVTINWNTIRKPPKKDHNFFGKRIRFD